MNMTTPFTLPSCTPPRAYTPSPCSCQRCKKDNQCPKLFSSDNNMDPGSVPAELTMHKSQGQTLDNAVIDLGPKEACTGLTFVCLSRAKRLVDLIVEPMSFDRIGNLGKSSTMKVRLQEEVRLAELAQSTTVRYTEMGVFSAVAGGN